MARRRSAPGAPARGRRVTTGLWRDVALVAPHRGAQALLALLQRLLPSLNLCDVAVDADRAAIERAELAHREPAPVAQMHLPRPERRAPMGEPVREPALERHEVGILGQEVLVGGSAEVLDVDAERELVAERTEELPQLAVVQHQTVGGVPDREAFRHRLGRLHEAIAGGPQLVEIDRQPLDHAVEGAADPGDLVLPRDVDPHREFAARDPIRGVGQLRQPAGQDEAHREADHGDRRHPGDRDRDAEVAGLAIGEHQREVGELDRQGAERARLTPDRGAAPIAVLARDQGRKWRAHETDVGGGDHPAAGVADDHGLHAGIALGALDEGLKVGVLVGQQRRPAEIAEQLQGHRLGPRDLLVDVAHGVAERHPQHHPDQNGLEAEDGGGDPVLERHAGGLGRLYFCAKARRRER